MKIFCTFDCYADILEVPEEVGCRIKKYRNKFLDWLYDRKNHHGYWVKLDNGNGKAVYGVQYGSDAFVDWLNKKVLKGKEPRAVVIERDLDRDTYTGDIPYIWF